jgi:hypothetical protein
VLVAGDARVCPLCQRGDRRPPEATANHGQVEAASIASMRVAERIHVVLHPAVSELETPLLDAIIGIRLAALTWRGIDSIMIWLHERCRVLRRV